MSVKIKFRKSVNILGVKFKIKWDKTHDDASFSFIDNTMEIGTQSYKKNKLYTFSIISHEVMESILQMMGARYTNGRQYGMYVFNFNHQTFENAIEIHAQVLNKFIKKSGKR